MKTGYKVSSTKIYNCDNAIIVFNHQEINLVNNFSTIDIKGHLNSPAKVGFWKIKSLKN